MPEHEQAKANRLARESSPYLRLHAHNPVDWYPWGEEAFARARTEDKPIFLSVGYSTCYWCHVMERECFSDPEIARQMNEGFVSIKLDREERPDVDDIYMSATQLMTRAGGWPNSVFLTPDRKPFFAGTYFPPRDAMGRPGFPRVLAALREAWAFRRGELLAQAESVAEAMRQQLGRAPLEPSPPDPAFPERVLAGLEERFDLRFGGFGRAPKFPSPANLDFLLELARGGNGEAREMLVVTLDHMARGGIFDQLGGGFHRYSTDESWLVPHFEKMLYDNAALLPLYAEAAAYAPELGFDAVARATADFVLRELTSPEGAFWSALDAETDGHEGAYYTWTKAELEALLAGGDRPLFEEVFGLTGPPNFEQDRYVLSLPLPFGEAARRLNQSESDLGQKLQPGLLALRAARETRPRPLLDDKVLTDWNGLMIGGLARAGAALREPRYVEAARAAAELVLDRAVLSEEKTLAHVSGRGPARIAALLDDYAFLIRGLVALARASGDDGYLREAVRLQEEQDHRLLDPVGGGYYAAGDDPDLLFRAKPAFDGAVASGNGTSAQNLVVLRKLTGNADYEARADAVLSAFSDNMAAVPLGHVTMAHALVLLSAPKAAAEAPPAFASADDRGAHRGAASVPGGALEELDELARSVVTVETRVEPGAEGWRPFTVDLVIKDGWHIGGHGQPSPDLLPTTLHPVLGKVRALRYPEPGVGGSAPPAYRGRLRISGEIEAPNAGAPSLELTYQACDEGRCLPPVTRLVRFP